MAEMPFAAPLSVAEATKLSESVVLTQLETILIDAAIDEFVPEKRNLSFNVPTVSATWAIVKTSVSAIFPFGVQIQSRDDSGAVQQLAHIGISLRVAYSVPEGASLESLRHYIAVCGALQCWPYFRTEVHQLSVKLGFPALLLPVLLAQKVREIVEIGAPAQAPPPDEPETEAIQHVPPPDPQRPRTKRRAKTKAPATRK